MLNTAIATSMMEALKEIFARFGITSVVVSGNGPQYDSSPPLKQKFLEKTLTSD